METIFVITGSGPCKSYERMGNSIYIGRSPENDIQVLDVSVSRRHLRIKEENNRIFINDLHSKNGTYINGIPVEPGVDFEIKENAPVVIGMSVICIGKTCLDRVSPFIESLKSSYDESSAEETSFTRSLTNIKDTRLIRNVNRILDISGSLNELVENLLELIMEHFLRVDRGVIILFTENEKGKTKETVISRKEAEDNGVNKNYSRKVVDLVVSTKKPVAVLDSSKGGDPGILNALKLLKIGSVMCIPLIKGDRAVGALYIDSCNKPYGFRQDDLRLFTLLADLTANAIETYLHPENDI